MLKAPAGEHDVFSRPKGFDLEIYRRHFAPYHWTHVRGFRELVEVYQLEPYFDSTETVSLYLQGLRAVAAQRLPPSWSDFQFKSAQWSACHAAPIARVCKGNPARLDQACHAVVALQIAYERAQNTALRKINIFDYIEILPAAYALRNLSKLAEGFLRGELRESAEEKDRERYSDLVSTLCPKDNKNEARGRLAKAKIFLADVADGRALTWDSAQAIRTFVSGPWGTPNIHRLRSRTDAGRREPQSEDEEEEVRLRCCDHESEFVKLDDEKSVELRERAGRKEQFGR